MRRCLFLSAVLLLFVIATSSAGAQDVLVPAGTLLKCTMNEPNFSSATAQVGDPVLCHLSSVQEFGRNAFPRGAYMSGHLEADKEPGHFVGKGYLKVVFDRIGTPNADINIDTKVIAARGYHVDKEGDIKGKGHAKRDVIEWMIPPLWPWKVLTLPARGPRPTLKGEETLTLRLMEDVTVPRTGASYSSRDWNFRDWRPPQAQIHERPATYQAYPDAQNLQPVLDRASLDRPSKVLEPTTSVAPATTNARFVTSVDPAFREASQTRPEPQPASPLQIAAPASPAISSRNPRDGSASLTLIALRNETIWAVSEYWLDGDRLDYILPSGSHESCALNEVDLTRTTQLNSERGISISFHDAPVHQPAL